MHIKNVGVSFAKGKEMKFELLHPADQIVMLMQRIYDFGMTTTSGATYL